MMGDGPDIQKDTKGAVIPKKYQQYVQDGAADLSSGNVPKTATGGKAVLPKSPDTSDTLGSYTSSAPADWSLAEKQTFVLLKKAAESLKLGLDDTAALYYDMALKQTVPTDHVILRAGVEFGRAHCEARDGKLPQAEQRAKAAMELMLGSDKITDVQREHLTYWQGRIEKSGFTPEILDSQLNEHYGFLKDKHISLNFSNRQPRLPFAYHAEKQAKAEAAKEAETTAKKDPPPKKEETESGAAPAAEEKAGKPQGWGSRLGNWFLNFFR
jgi:hypothetical protein